jgi:hypothetical protein
MKLTLETLLETAGKTPTESAHLRELCRTMWHLLSVENQDFLWQSSAVRAIFTEQGPKAVLQLQKTLRKTRTVRR